MKKNIKKTFFARRYCKFEGIPERRDARFAYADGAGFEIEGTRFYDRDALGIWFPVRGDNGTTEKETISLAAA